MNNRFIDKARGRRRQVRVRGYMRDREIQDYGMYDNGRRRYDMNMNDSRRNDYNSYDGHYNQPMGYFGYGSIMPDYGRRGRRDYGQDYENDYNNDYGYDYASGEEDYKQELQKWCNKLKQKDRFNLRKEEVIKKAKEMQVKFDDFNEEEFYAVYLMLISDFKNQFNDPHMYIKMAKDWLMDDDIEVNPSEKLWLYLNYIVLGKEE